MTLLSTLALALAAFFSKPQNKGATNRPAPEFPVVAAERWLNSPPLKMADLRGQVLLLEVWTFM